MSVVIGIRVPKKVKEELERLGIDYTREIREFLLKRIREEKIKILIKEIMEVRKEIGVVKGNVAAEIVREERESR